MLMILNLRNALDIRLHKYESSITYIKELWIIKELNFLNNLKQNIKHFVENFRKTKII